MRVLSVLYVIGYVLMMISCTKNTKSTDLTTAHIIPKPVAITATGKSFNIQADCKIILFTENEELTSLARYLANIMRPSTGFTFDIIANSTPIKNSIFIELLENSDLAEEAYIIEIIKDYVHLKRGPQKVFSQSANFSTIITRRHRK